jgi:alpha-beta hydrolase superfamily lysophospholipase
VSGLVYTASRPSPRTTRWSSHRSSRCRSASRRATRPIPIGAQGSARAVASDGGALQERDRAPLPIVGAEKDHTVPASVSAAQYRKYEKSPARTEYLEFAGRPHLYVVGEGWEEVADAIEGWLQRVREVEPTA